MKMGNLLVLDDATIRRANVIARRTNDSIMAVIKAQMINTLKAKLANGYCKFSFYKQSTGEIVTREGTTIHPLMKEHINGRGVSGDEVNTIKYWDFSKNGFRSLRYENLIRVY